MKPIEGTEHAQTMVDGLGSWLRIFIEPITDIVEQSGFIHFLRGGRGGMTWEPPACEVQQIIPIGTQGTEGQLANALRVEKGIDPGDFLLPLIDQAVG